MKMKKILKKKMKGKRKGKTKFKRERKGEGEEKLGFFLSPPYTHTHTLSLSLARPLAHLSLLALGFVFLACCLFCLLYVRSLPTYSPLPPPASAPSLLFFYFFLFSSYLPPCLFPLPKYYLLSFSSLLLKGKEKQLHRAGYGMLGDLCTFRILYEER
jgi:hypothetical protein